MVVYDPQKHHRRSTRLPGFDYSQPGYYFVTFCVHLRECLLADVIGDSVGLSTFGQIVRDVFDQTAVNLWNVSIDQDVVMPNHAHVIYRIHEWTQEIETAFALEVSVRSQSDPLAPDLPIRSLTRKPTLGQIVAFHKYETTRRINRARNMAGTRFWQRGFYEHIVRTQRELDAIRRYIINNPRQWALDRDNPKNIAGSMTQ